MKKPLDRISEAYYGEMGFEFEEKVKNRIHWICENAKGEKILDIGCSQGITSILLGRECKKVIGIDLHEESINYAKDLLKKEDEVTQKYISFELNNFMNMEFYDEKFDSIILGEILEHIFDPRRFVEKAINLINEKGRVIITVPFGVNNYFDHKKTYYLSKLMEITQGYKINEIAFFGKWIGFIINKADIFSEELKPITISFSLLREMENSFYLIEKEYLRTIQEKKQKIENLFEEEKEVIDLEDENGLIRELEDKNGNLKNINNSLLEDINIKKNEILSLEKENLALEKTLENKVREIKTVNEALEEYKKQLINEKNTNIKLREEKVTIQKNLYDAYDKEKKHLSSYEILLQKFERINKKYIAISNSKLGGLTLKYWKWRKKLIGGK